MTEKTTPPDELGAASCSLLVDCTEDVQEFPATLEGRIHLQTTGYTSLFKPLKL